MTDFDPGQRCPLCGTSPYAPVTFLPFPIKLWSIKCPNCGPMHVSRDALEWIATLDAVQHAAISHGVRKEFLPGRAAVILDLETAERLAQNTT